MPPVFFGPIRLPQVRSTGQLNVAHNFLSPLRRNVPQCVRTRPGSVTRRLFSSTPLVSSPKVAITPDPSNAPTSQISNPAGISDPADPAGLLPTLPFRFETGFALLAKKKPRAFPPPFLSPPSKSFSDPLSTHAEPTINGTVIGGTTNGDDAVYAGKYFLAVNDGVGAWSRRPRGHAGLWSRLMIHYWVLAIQKDMIEQAKSAPSDTMPHYVPNPISYLQEAYEKTIESTKGPPECYGTTTVASAQLSFRGDTVDKISPVLHITNLGDSQTIVIRPNPRKVLFKSKEQWHWFDCPRQLGTNSPDEPAKSADITVLDISTGDIILVVSDGVTDNLWEHEIVEAVIQGLEAWETNKNGEQHEMDCMTFVAVTLREAAKVIAFDHYAESPYMERAIDEGLASEGGKPDDISVVVGRCVRNTA